MSPDCQTPRGVRDEVSHGLCPVSRCVCSAHGPSTLLGDVDDGKVAAVIAGLLETQWADGTSTGPCVPPAAGGPVF